MYWLILIVSASGFENSVPLQQYPDRASCKAAGEEVTTVIKRNSPPGANVIHTCLDLTIST